MLILNYSCYLHLFQHGLEENDKKNRELAARSRVRKQSKILRVSLLGDLPLSLLIQSFAVILIYVQIACALIGSLGALYSGVSLINLGIGLFALVAIESSSQSLGRTYAVLLFCAILVDVSWFILFASEIWNISSEIYGTFVIFSVKLTLSMQIIGFCVRLSSSLLWIQMYKLGVSYIDSSVPREADSDMRNSFLNPATPITRQPSNSDDALGGSVYDPAYYSSLFEDGKDETYFCRDDCASRIWSLDSAVLIFQVTFSKMSQYEVHQLKISFEFYRIGIVIAAVHAS
ncbi:hypothetical protein K7X08_010524 [Anisodus acutangulus]|uniref:Uncharacterized protein n=1 Tax=Anisodus acutangulus TaxID=402998 RepID=A0A9Q1RVU8_9SOLA|nr:hypothetical protein K7X08_010524 [Anisodus acutangulus]